MSFCINISNIFHFQAILPNILTSEKCNTFFDIILRSIRTKGEPGTGDIVQAVRHMRKMNSQIAEIVSMRTDELYEAAKKLEVPYDLVQYVHENHRLPVVNFAAGGVATPADAALMMQLGAEGVFVGSGIFKSGDPAKRAAAIVQATTNYNDADLVAKLSEGLGEAMVGINEQEIDRHHKCLRLCFNIRSLRKYDHLSVKYYPHNN